MASNSIVSSSAESSSLPVEMWTHILCFLPVKTLLIVRSVSKLFLSIIDEPHFVSLHLCTFPENIQENRILVLHQHYLDEDGLLVYPLCEAWETRKLLEESDGNVIFPDTISEIPFLPASENLLTAATLFDCTPPEALIMGSVDGLRLLVNLPLAIPGQHLLITKGDMAVLWNLSIKKTRTIPFPSGLDFLAIDNLGLGYDASCKDYKALAILDHNLVLNPADHDLPDVWVFSVKAGSWTPVHDSGRVANSSRYCPTFVMSKRVSFKGGLVWTEGGDFIDRNNRRLVWFDFRTNKFRRTKMPHLVDKIRPTWGETRIAVLDGGSSLGLWGADPDDESALWALEEDTMSWSRRYKIDARVFSLVGDVHNRKVMCVKKNGELMLVLEYRTGDPDVVGALSYNFETRRIKEYRDSPLCITDSMEVYVESLVMLN